MHDRKKDRRNMIAGLQIITILILGEIYYIYTKTQPIYLILISFMFICLVCIVEIYGIRQYYEKYIKPERTGQPVRLSRVEKRRKSLYQPFKENDMYAFCKAYQKDHTKGRIILSIILSVLFVGAMLIKYSSVSLWISVPITGVSAFGIFIFCLRDARFDSINRLRRAVEQSGYDPQTIEDDFKLGSKHSLPEGFLHIGQDFIVLFDKTNCCVCPIHEIVCVCGQETTGTITPLPEYYVKIELERGYIRLKCMDLVGAAFMLERFTQLGIETVNQLPS